VNQATCLALNDDEYENNAERGLIQRIGDKLYAYGYWFVFGVYQLCEAACMLFACVDVHGKENEEDPHSRGNRYPAFSLCFLSSSLSCFASFAVLSFLSTLPIINTSTAIFNRNRNTAIRTSTWWRSEWSRRYSS
jgi:hypothetical protein